MIKTTPVSNNDFHITFQYLQTKIENLARIHMYIFLQTYVVRILRSINYIRMQTTTLNLLTTISKHHAVFIFAINVRGLVCAVLALKSMSNFMLSSGSIVNNYTKT